MATISEEHNQLLEQVERYREVVRDFYDACETRQPFIYRGDDFRRLSQAAEVCVSKYHDREQFAFGEVQRATRFIANNSKGCGTLYSAPPEPPDLTLAHAMVDGAMLVTDVAVSNLIIRKDASSNAYSDGDGQTLTERQQEVLFALVNCSEERLSQSAWSAAAGCGLSTLKRHLTCLTRGGWVDPPPKGRRSGYAATEKAKQRFGR